MNILAPFREGSASSKTAVQDFNMFIVHVCIFYEMKARGGGVHCTSIMNFYYCFYQFHILKNNKGLLPKI